jgi:hypothetical protein
MIKTTHHYTVFYLFYILYSAILICHRLTPDTFNIPIHILSSVQLMTGFFLIYNTLRKNYVNERGFLVCVIALTIVNGLLILVDSSTFYGWTFYGVAMDVYRIVLICGIASHRIWGLNHMRNYGKKIFQSEEREGK